MARRYVYVSVKPLIIHGRTITPGKQIIGVKKHRLEQLVRCGKARILEDEPIYHVAVKEILVHGEVIWPGQVVKGLTQRKYKTLVKMRVIKEVFEADRAFITPEDEKKELEQGQENKEGMDGNDLEL